VADGVCEVVDPGTLRLFSLGPRSVPLLSSLLATAVDGSNLKRRLYEFIQMGGSPEAQGLVSWSTVGSHYTCGENRYHP